MFYQSIRSIENRLFFSELVESIITFMHFEIELNRIECNVSAFNRFEIQNARCEMHTFRN